MPGRRFSVEAVFRAIDRVTAPVTRMQNRVNKMTRSVSRGLDKMNRRMDKFGSRARRGALVVAAGAAVAGAVMVDVIKTGAEFEQSLISAAAKFPGEIRRGTDAYQQLEDAAREAGRTTEFTAGQSAGALNFFAMAGLNAVQSVAALPGAIDLATIAQIDLARSTDIATDTLGAFNLMTDDAAQLAKNLTRVNDVMAKTTTTANTDLEQMFETITKGGPIATMAGQDIETFAALLGKMAGAGVKASIAGTALKKFFTSIVKQKSLLEGMGVEVEDTNGNFRDAVDILGDFIKATKEMGEVQRSAAVEAVFGERSLAGVTKLLLVGEDAIRGYRDELYGATGTAATMAAVIRDSLKNELRELNSAIESVKLSSFERIRDAVSDIVTQATEWVRVNETAIAQNVAGFFLTIFNNLDLIASTAEKVLKVTVAVVGLVVVMKSLILVLTLVNLLIGVSPMAWLVIGIVAAVAAIVWLVSKIPGIEKLGAVFVTVGEAIKTGFLWAFNGIKKAWDATFNGIKSGLEWVQNAYANTKGFIGGVGDFLGFGGDDEGGAGRDGDGAVQPQVVGRGEQVARSFEERNSIERGELIIRDETGGRVEPGAGQLPGGIQLLPSGGF